jgi:hypothetical protein
MLIGEDFVIAEDKYRRERYEWERRSGAGSVRKTAAAALLVVLIVSACGGIGPNTRSEGGLPAAGNLVVDLAPVGSPSISALRGYEAPEMWPVAAGHVEAMLSYEFPEMWPEAQEAEYVEPASGPH